VGLLEKMHTCIEQKYVNALNSNTAKYPRIQEEIVLETEYSCKNISYNCS